MSLEGKNPYNYVYETFRFRIFRSVMAWAQNKSMFLCFAISFSFSLDTSAKTKRIPLHPGLAVNPIFILALAVGAASFCMGLRFSRPDTKDTAEDAPRFFKRGTPKIF